MNGATVVDILLVEDNPRDAELVVRALRRQHLTQPVTVLEDGAEALDFILCRGAYAGRAGTKPPKVIMLDLKLPKVGGLEVLKAVKTDARTRCIPVVVVTSSREDADIRMAYELGANGYVVKPVNSDEFLDSLGRLGLYWLSTNQPPP